MGDELMRHGLKTDAKDSSLVLYYPNALGNIFENGG